jgi:G3E family GTPase
MTAAHVITGSFGAGKTTAIRQLMAAKPEAELWVVILNEFTDLGMDALNVAQSSCGRYDIRLVAGGCLCCVGELEFGRQVRDILRNLKPARLLIEPSGAGHAADIVDELGRYVAQRVLSLDSIICLVDALDAVRIARTPAGNDWSQIQSCDVLLLSKPDLADGAARRAFGEIAAAQFPPKRYIGECERGRLPPEALLCYERGPRFTPVAAATAAPESFEPADDGRPFAIGGHSGGEWRTTRLGHTAVGWILPAALVFSRVTMEPRLEWLVRAYGGSLRRFKAVLRTGPGPSWQVQSAGHGLAGEDSAYRRDSRLELVFTTPPAEELLDQWRALLRDAANPGDAANAGDAAGASIAGAEPAAQ